MWCASVAGDLRNFFRAGVLKKRSRTCMTVPTAQPAGAASSSLPPSIRTRVPSSISAVRERMVNRLIEAIEGSASPRKPSVVIRSMSSAEKILLVPCGSMQSRTSSASMPEPLSETLISRDPARSISMRIRVAPASMAFSTSSLTTDAGRSITSPAAIRLLSCSSITLILLMGRVPPGCRRAPASRNGARR